jgi:hypothetical protein
LPQDRGGPSDHQGQPPPPRSYATTVASAGSGGF